jgi:hypothetical protein
VLRGAQCEDRAHLNFLWTVSRRRCARTCRAWLAATAVEHVLQNVLVLIFRRLVWLQPLPAQLPGIRLHFPPTA